MQHNWFQSNVLINNVKLNYYRTGQKDKRSLILVHGFSDSGLCWLQTARELESEFNIIIPDMCGHGFSERMQSDQKVDMVSDLVGLIYVLGLKDPIIIGHSMGAMITYQIGIRYPDLPHALVLEDPPWWLEESSIFPHPSNISENLIIKWAKNLPNQTLGELLTQYRSEHPDWAEELIIPLCESKKQLDPMIVDIMTSVMRYQKTSWVKTISNINKPILLLTGDPKLGGIITNDVITKIKELNPQINIINIINAGHLIRFDNFTDYMKALHLFLKQV